jgi:biopolymer transport protein ExbD
MDALDKFFKKFSYKFPKGYPDINDEQDMLMLEGMLKEMGINLPEGKAEDRDEAKAILKKELNLTDKDFKDSGLQFFVLVPGKDRLSIVDTIEKIETNSDKKFEYNPQPSSFSSIGHFMFGQAKFGIKPSEKQGGRSAGLENESVLVDAINPLLQDGPKTVIITDGSSNITYKNVTNVEGTGTKTSDYSKADVNFYNNKTDLGGLSLKKDNAVFWESADVRYKDVTKNLLDAITSGKLKDKLSFKPFVDNRGNEDPNIIRLYDKTGKQGISGVIVTDLPDQDIFQMIFGNDKVPVAVRTFRSGDVKLEGNDVIVRVSKLYKTVEDVEADNAEPILNIRHDKTRRASKGLRALVQTKKSLYRNDRLAGSKISIPYDEFN